MAATVPLDKSTYMKEWIAQVDPPKEASTFARMNGRPKLLFSNKMTHYYLEWTTPSALLKKNYITFTKNLML